jgi:hypoxanthine phosphoribosyltransferase
MSWNQSDLDKMKSKFPEAIRLSWEDAEDLIWQMSESIVHAKYDPDVIIGISRGGLVPGRILADYLQKKYLCTIQMGHWDESKGFTDNSHLVYPLPDINLKNKKVLVVDDVCDVGDTMIGVEKYLTPRVGNLKVAILARKADSKYTPSYCPMVLEEWRWIFFPWSTHEDLLAFVEKVLRVTGGATIEEIIRILEYSMDVEFAIPEIERALLDMKNSGEIVVDKRKKWRLV